MSEYYTCPFCLLGSRKNERREKDATGEYIYIEYTCTTLLEIRFAAGKYFKDWLQKCENPSKLQS